VKAALGGLRPQARRISRTSFKLIRDDTATANIAVAALLTGSKHPVGARRGQCPQQADDQVAVGRTVRRRARPPGPQCGIVGAREPQWPAHSGGAVEISARASSRSTMGAAETMNDSGCVTCASRAEEFALHATPRSASAAEEEGVGSRVELASTACRLAHAGRTSQTGCADRLQHGTVFSSSCESSHSAVWWRVRPPGAGWNVIDRVSVRLSFTSSAVARGSAWRARVVIRLQSGIRARDIALRAS